MKNWIRWLILSGLVAAGSLITNKAKAVALRQFFIDTPDCTTQIYRKPTGSVDTLVAITDADGLWVEGTENFVPPANLGDTLYIRGRKNGKSAKTMWIRGPPGSNEIYDMHLNKHTVNIENVIDTSGLSQPLDAIYSLDGVAPCTTEVDTGYDQGWTFYYDIHVPFNESDATQSKQGNIDLVKTVADTTWKTNIPFTVDRTAFDAQALASPIYFPLEKIVTDNKSPGKPTNLKANGSNPSAWTNSPNFTISWTNPSDSDLEKALYKIGVPATDWDTTGSLSPSSPGNVSVTSQGVHPLYLWLADSSDNTSKDSSAVVNLRYDATPPSGSIASSPDTSKTLDFLVSWSAGSDFPYSGVASYKIKVREGIESWSDWKDTTSLSANFSGQHGKIYYFESAARDSADNLETFTSVPECSTVIDTTTPDMTPPSISSVTELPDTTDVTSNYKINYVRSDGSGIAEDSLIYRINGEASKAVSPDSVKGDTAYATIADTADADTYLYYRIKVVDGSDNANAAYWPGPAQSEWDSCYIKPIGIGEQAKQPEKFKAWHARDGLHIKGAKQASVYDLVGRKVLDGLDNGIHKLRTPSGIYFIKEEKGRNKGNTEKIVKMR